MCRAAADMLDTTILGCRVSIREKTDRISGNPARPSPNLAPDSPSPLLPHHAARTLHSTSEASSFHSGRVLRASASRKTCLLDRWEPCDPPAAAHTVPLFAAAHLYGRAAVQGVQQNSLRCFSGALRAGTPQDSLKQCSVERSVFVQQRPESVPTAARIPLHSCTDLRALAARIAADRFPIRGLGHGAARSATGKVTPAAGGESKRIRTPALERSKSLAAKGCSETLRRWHRTVACRQ